MILGPFHFYSFGHFFIGVFSCTRHDCCLLHSPHGPGLVEMKRSHSQNNSPPRSTIVSRTSFSSAASHTHRLRTETDTSTPGAPPSKLRRGGSRLLSALKSLASRTHGELPSALSMVFSWSYQRLTMAWSLPASTLSGAVDVQTNLAYVNERSLARSQTKPGYVDDDSAKTERKLRKMASTILRVPNEPTMVCRPLANKRPSLQA